MALNPNSLTREEKEVLGLGGVIVVNGKRYRWCKICLKVIRMDGFFGGIHLCKEDT